MPAEVLYRKWRPQSFADVAGQELVTRTLINALSSHKVSHAYLFSGPRGTGKTTMARLLAKALNCEKNAGDRKDSPGEPCNVCPSCVAFGEGSALDLIEMDGASNRGIDDIRELREKTGYAAMGGAMAHKVYLIDEVHMLTDAAFNALLKTLEEPPPHVVFILATTDDHKVPPTIVSRCQRHAFKRIPLSASVARLEYIAEQEGIEIPREGLEMIARGATGSLRDAINLVEQICDSYGKHPSLEAVREGLGLIADERATDLAIDALKGEFARGLQTIGAVRDDGLDLRQFQKEVVMRLRELLHVHSGADTGAWSPEQMAEMKALVEGVPRERLVQALRAFGQADLRADPLSPLPLELALADSIMGPPASAASVAQPAARPAAPMARPAAPPSRQAPPQPRPPAASAPLPPAPKPRGEPEPDRVPSDFRRDLANASAEDIARMLGSRAPVIPPASDEPEPAPSVVPAATVTPATPVADGASNGGAGGGLPLAPASAGGVDLASIVPQIRTLARPRGVKFDALLNGSCDAVSWQDGVLTLGFYEDKFHKKGVEEAANRRVYEELASEILGAPVTIRCIISPRPARAMKSPLVQHAVENHGATIVTGDQER
jgi:DNA polymerase-3 subunit gamma/tau